MLSLFILLFNYVRKSFQSIFLGFALPVILLVILVPIIRSFNPDDAETIVLPGLVMSVAPILGVVSLGMAYADFKQSIILKRIGATPIKAHKFLVTVLLFYVVLIILGSLWMLGLGSLFYYKTINFANINWSYVFLAIILLAFMCCPIGMTIGIIAKDAQIANALGFLIYIPTSFLAGQYIPFFALRRQDILVQLSKAIPFTYPVSIINRAWNYYGNPDLLSQFSLFDNFWLPSVASLVWIIGSSIFTSLLYKYWNK